MNLGNIPMIGPRPEIRASVQGILAMPRKMDENCSWEPESVAMTPEGRPVALAGRDNVVDATDLVEMIVDALRPVIRAEIAVARRKQDA